jgi:hypothetical protein
MSKVTVYNYRIYDGANDTNDIRPVKATAEAIERFKGMIVEGTAETIDASLLDGQGVYRPEWTLDEVAFLHRLAKGHWISTGLFDHRQFKRLVESKLITATAVNLSDAHPRLTKNDWLGALGICLLSFLSTFPIVVPFLFISDARLALRVSNAIAIAMLFLCGFTFGHYAGFRPVAMSLSMVALGSAFVGIAVALGG